MLKQKKERCLTFFAETKFAVSGAPSTRIFELMGSSQLGVPEGYSVPTESPSRALLFYTEKQVHPTEEERDSRALLSGSSEIQYDCPGGFLGFRGACPRQSICLPST